MRVLDLDLDLFLMDCCPLAEPGERPGLAGHEPWDEADVIRFLEEGCGLSADRPIPGRVFETHDGALDLWNEQILSGRLSVPFHVTHADAHSDLGIGYPGPDFVLHNVLARPPEKRPFPAEYRDARKLDEANYLLFALAFRWIRSLDNVRNPRSRPDLPPALSEAPGILRASSLTSRIFESRNGKEPAVPYRVFSDPGEFHAEEPYDLASLALSPRYAPREADRLSDIFRRYIIPI